VNIKILAGEYCARFALTSGNKVISLESQEKRIFEATG